MIYRGPYRSSISIRNISRNNILPFSIILQFTIVGALGIVSYVTGDPRQGEQFTEFYILGLSGKAVGYPEDLAVGQKGELIIDNINLEREPIACRVQVAIDGVNNNTVGPVTLENGVKLEKLVSFASDRAENHKMLEFLFKSGGSEPYRELRLWINVREQK